MGSQSFRSEQRITHRHLAPYACRTRYARGLKDPESEKRLDDRALKALVEGGSGWRREGNALTKTYIFKGFKAAMAFANRVAEAANAANHHPDIHIEGYRNVRMVLTTHSAGGITDADVELAARIDRTERAGTPSAAS